MERWKERKIEGWCNEDERNKNGRKGLSLLKDRFCEGYLKRRCKKFN